MNPIKSLKLGLYSPSIIIVLLAWYYSKFNNLLYFIILLLIVLLFQMGMNLGMDYNDYLSGIPVSNKDTLFPSGPYSIIEDKLSPTKVKLASTFMFIMSAILALILLIFTRNIELLYVGLLAVIAGLLYLIPPIQLYKRGLGEISTFLDFGPILMAGSLLVLNGSITLRPMIVSIGFGLQTSAIRFIHHIVDENHKSFRVKNYRKIYGFLLLLSYLPFILISKYLELIPFILSVLHLIALPKDYRIASRKVWVTLLLQLLSFFILL